MALLTPNDIAIHEAGHVLICYLMNDIIELYHVTIDEEFSKTIDTYSDGGLLYRYLKNPNLLDFLELDQFSLLHLAGLAADIVNELDGKVENNFFSTNEFINKINHFNYQGDMMAFSNNFEQFHEKLKVTPQYYNYNSIKLLVDLFMNENIQKLLIEIREIINFNKTLNGKVLTDFLDNSFFRNYKLDNWIEIKKSRKDLFIFVPILQ